MVSLRSIFTSSILAAGLTRAHGSSGKTCPTSEVSPACYANQWETTFPPSDIKITGATWVQDNIYDVTLSYEAESLELENLTELKIIGLNSPTGGTKLVWSLNSKVYDIDNPAKWTTTLRVYTKSSADDCYVEMYPFQIQVDWCEAGASTDGCSAWKWPKSYDYDIGCDNMQDGVSRKHHPVYKWPKKCSSNCGVEPTTSDEPEEPTTSEEPEEPTTSEEPEEPTSSDEEPTTSEEPEEPTTSDEPEEPTTSEEPEEPTTSEEPEEPTTSEEPEEPTTSDEEPGTTEEPLVPTTKTETDVSTTLLTVTDCGTKTCTKSLVITGVTKETVTTHGKTTVITTYCPLPTETVTPTPVTVTSTIYADESVTKTTVYTTGAVEKTVTVGGSSTVVVVHTPLTTAVVQSQSTDEIKTVVTARPSTTTIVRDVCYNSVCSVATIVTGVTEKTITFSTGSITVVPTYVPLVESEEHQRTASTSETRATSVVVPTVVGQSSSASATSSIFPSVTIHEGVANTVKNSMISGAVALLFNALFL